jgi:hypothetical protein
MNLNIPERDWKKLRSFKPEMLNTLCERINKKAEKRINKKAEKRINSTDKNEHEKFLDLYQCINNENETVALCFDDWRRSNIRTRILALLTEKLLTDEHIEQLSDEAKRTIDFLIL